MRPWQPLLVVVPAGIVLGAIGGHLARPVPQQRLGDPQLQQLFQTRAEREGRTPADPPAAEQDSYVGGTSYVPDYVDKGDRDITGWHGPDFSNWPEYKPAPMPTLEQLEAEVAARDAALDRWAAAHEPTAAPPDTADAPPQVAVADPADTRPSAEPRTPDGALPAIW